jgi:hypothetical protein
MTRDIFVVRRPMARLIVGVGFFATLMPQTAALLQAAEDQTSAAQPTRETWDALYIQGGKIGHAHTAETPVVENDRKLVKLEGEVRMTLKRFGRSFSQRISYTSFETPDGDVVRVESTIKIGPNPIQVRGRVVGDKLHLEVTTRGKTQQSTIPWSKDYRGFFWAEQIVRREMLKPGETRTYQSLAPVFNQVATTTLTAKHFAKTTLLNGEVELLQVSTLIKLPGGGKIESTMWVDRTGEVRKVTVPLMRQETFRTTRSVALSKVDDMKFDLGADATIRISKPIKAAHSTKTVRYRVRLEGGDPSATFLSGPSQSVKSIDKNTVEITVRAVRPGGDAPKGRSVKDADRKPNNLIQSDDALVMALATRVAPDETDSWKLAVALETFVHRAIKKKDFSTAFATAAEVAEKLSGDCTEHAVLLAALARARGIPARVAIGLVYMQSQQRFGYHMWTEVHVKGRWIPLDATLGQGGIGAGHLKLADSNMKGASGLSSFLPVAQVLGRLKIEVIDVK